MIQAILLAAAAASGPCDSAQTQQQLDACYAARAKQSASELNAAYTRAQSDAQKGGLDLKVLASDEAAFEDARKATCAFEASLAEGGTAAPMVILACNDRMARARIVHLNAISSRLDASKASPKPESPVSLDTDAALNSLYSALAKKLSAQQQKALTASDVSWIPYRDQTCRLEGGTCLNDMENERIAELKAGWIGEPIW